ncbi:MAG: hypothetical protein Q8P95_00570, partial [bacterium]|nr:hypothetical protein [bacterium]
WELVVPLSLARNKVVVSAQELGSADKKMVANFTVKVDEEGPLLGKILLPAIDANDNAELSSEELELRGEIGSDAVRVCVVHNEDEPYCLKQFRAGDKTYRYAGSIGYGNVSRGKNKYAIRAYDQFDNVSQKVIYIFQGVAKPDGRVEEETAEDSTSPKVPDAPSAELPKPVITDPDPTVTFQTDEPELRIRGTVSAGTQAIYVNDKRASFQAGSDSFELTITLEMGENNIRVQAGDGQGNKSKTALLRAVYIEAEAEE